MENVLPIEPTLLIEQFRSFMTNKIYHYCWKSIPIFDRYKEDSITLCIIYPKGKRPDLGYPVNNKKEKK